MIIYERYLNDPVIEYYDDIESIKEKYKTYSYIIDENVKNLESGDSVEFMYDFYIDMIVEKLNF